jgi:hypothetical protein
LAAVPDKPATTDEEIFDECAARLKLASDAESENRKEALHDLKFSNGDQWPIDIKRDRDADARPCLTINITDAMVRRVTNALRENRPRIKFHPVKDSDIEVAKVRNGLMRHIETSSNADYAYDTAVESAVRGGWGYIRVGSRYIDDRAFDQDLTIEGVPNPFTYYLDPASTMPDGSDAQWCIASHWMRRDEYKMRFGDRDPQGWQFVGPGDTVKDWANKEEVRIAEYWRISVKRDKLYLLSHGGALYSDELPPMKQVKADGLEVVREREVYRKHVQWFLVSGAKVLDRRDWPGKYLPIVPVYGRQVNVNGRIERKGMVRDLRDPARMYNYATTAKTEVYALMPKAPWMGPEGSTEGNEDAWRDANRKPIAFLPYKPIKNPDGTMAPPPQRQAPPQPNAGFAEWGDSTKADFLAVAGMPNDPGQDEQGQVVSGIAIKRRQGLSDISHFDFADNLTRSLKHLGQVISDLIPHFYDTERMQRIIGDDGVPSTVTINQRTAEGKVRNDMTGGLYDTVVDTGPGYQTKREEGAAAMLELLGTPLGQITAQVAGDLVVRSLDFPEADTIADRLAATIPAAQIDKNSDLPPKAQMMIKTLQQQIQQANQKAMALELELKSKHQLEHIRQEGETARKGMELHVRREDVQTKAATAVHDTHVRAVTAHDVAEINAAAQLLNTHAEAAHNERAAEQMLEHADKAEKRVE